MPRLRRQYVPWFFGILGCTFPGLIRAEDVGVQRYEADGVEVRLLVEPTQTTTAGRIVADLKVTAPTSATIEIEPLAAQPLGQLTVASTTRRGPAVVRTGVMEYGLRVVFTPFLGGTYDVPAFTVSYRSPQTSGQVVTRPVPLAVKSEIDGDPASAIPAGILAVEETPVPRWWLRSKWLDAAVFIIAVAGWVIFRRRQRTMPNQVPTPGPCASALAALAASPTPDARSLERVVETLRLGHSEPLPEALIQTYQWIRFGSPGVTEIERFTQSLKAHLRTRADEESAKEVT